ncbi:unnamed protein product [Ambrosiozyma monospora]|uniref:Unnamed protein product n=1 Tax=Ambrosiozyma monospora TaxID=43982 RepID=A0ACB5T7F8_AMBMO|nr:unnamed protein product [Ambrosiozyma monospora]
MGRPYNDPFFNFFDNIHREVEQMTDWFDRDPFFNNGYYRPQQPLVEDSSNSDTNQKPLSNKDNRQVATQSNRYNNRGLSPFFGGSFFNNDPFFNSQSLSTFSPPVDIHENDKSYGLSLSVPGAARDNVTIDFNTDTNELIIKGEVPDNRVEKKDEKGRLVYSERSYGSFQRMFKLPKNVDGQAIDAKFDNGVLSLNIPKVEEKEKKNLHRINIGGN